jgi:hypothetical protein
MISLLPAQSSDKALSHVVYLFNSTGAEIVILNVIENIHKIEPTTISLCGKSGRTSNI